MSIAVVNSPANLIIRSNRFRNILTNEWAPPIYYFNIAEPISYHPVHENKVYQKRVVKYFFLRLTEKWLHNTSYFDNLLKYFRINLDSNNNGKGEIHLVESLDKLQPLSQNIKYKDPIFEYVIKYFITKKLVKKILKQYLAKTKLKWYDLYVNSSDIKDFFVQKLDSVFKAAVNKNMETHQD